MDPIRLASVVALIILVEGNGVYLEVHIMKCVFLRLMKAFVVGS